MPQAYDFPNDMLLWLHLYIMYVHTSAVCMYLLKEILNFDYLIKYYILIIISISKVLKNL